MIMKNKLINLFLIALISVSCSKKQGKTEIIRLKAPSEVSVQRIGKTSIKLLWKDNSDKETGFSIWMRDIDNIQETKEIKKVNKDITETIIDNGLKEGKGYYFGVKAEGGGNIESSELSYTIFQMIPSGEIPSITLKGKPITSWASIALKYELSNIKNNPNTKYGLCWCKNGIPTVGDNMMYGPKIIGSDNSILQSVPATLLKENTEYTFRAFIITTSGEYYSEPVILKLNTQPQAINLNWKKLNKSDILPKEIEVYETVSNLNGRTFHAWYAIGDISKGNIAFKVKVPEKAMTIDSQVESDCYILSNGGYFYNGKHTGLAVINNIQQGSINPVRGSLRPSDSEYNVMYNVTRGVFGIEDSGKPFVCWAVSLKDGKHYYFASPLPSIKGEAKYEPLSSSSPQRITNLNAVYALSAGPVLLYEGKCPIDFSETDKGSEYYLNNFEIMPYDIFGENVICDRTAVGYTQDEKIVIFICDGRIPESRGANLLETAMILKGIGCKYAVNFDGGGSTGMMIGTTHINDITPNNRPVVSCLGFFKK